MERIFYKAVVWCKGTNGRMRRTDFCYHNDVNQSRKELLEYINKRKLTGFHKNNNSDYYTTEQDGRRYSISLFRYTKVSAGQIVTTNITGELFNDTEL